MNDPLTAIGATTASKQVLLLTCLIAGVVLLLAFLIPALGTALSARLMILIVIAFIGSGLIYLSLLPTEAEQAA